MKNQTNRAAKPVNRTKVAIKTAAVEGSTKALQAARGQVLKFTTRGGLTVLVDMRA